MPPTKTVTMWICLVPLKTVVIHFMDFSLSAIVGKLDSSFLSQVSQLFTPKLFVYH